jgi:hypothetical protein
MLLVVADNAVARGASKGNTVPVIRTGYHIGGHYELYQAEGVNPSVFSYIVGDVTIELARMLDLAQAHQVLVGDFQCQQSASATQSVTSITTISTESFVNACNGMLDAVNGIQLSSKAIDAMSCHLSQINDGETQSRPRRFRIVDKHGLSRHVYNLEISMDLAGRQRCLGLSGEQLPKRPLEQNGAEGQVTGASPVDVNGAAEDLERLLKKRSTKVMVED